MSTYKTRFTEAGLKPQVGGVLVVRCKVGNLFAGALMSTMTAVGAPRADFKCGKQYLDNGYIRFQDDNLIKCHGEEYHNGMTWVTPHYYGST